MRRKYERITAFHRVYGHTDHRHDGVRDWQQAGDDTDRLAVFAQPFFRDLLDDANTLLAQRVAQDAHDLEASRNGTVGIAHAAFCYRHLGQLHKGFFVSRRPRDGTR